MTPPFTIEGIEHIGIVPKDLVKAQQFFREILKLPSLGEELVADQGVRTLMFESRGASASSASGRLELLEASRDDSPITQFLQKKGGGIHHVALRVDKIEQALEYLQQQGVQLIDRKPRVGAHGTRVAFVHPHSTGGILVELVQT